jgi:arylsulfatase A-like enzyme
MRKIYAIGCLLVLTMGILSGQEKPNVVFILADDLGWADLGCMGSQLYESPNIDRIAESGIKFLNAYAANPLCSPTRASIMTGLWPSRVGITTPSCHSPEEILETFVKESAKPDQPAVAPISATRLKTEYVTLAESFKRAGYKTAHIGKWHLGPEPYDPYHHGFDVDIPHTPAPSPLPEGFFAPWPVYPGEGKTGDHLEDRMAEEAVEFIKKNADQPFLLHYWAFSVHSPWHTKQELIEKYEKLVDPMDPQHNPVYAGMVEVMDDAVGRLLETLEEEGILDNTIIVFFSDNGGWSWGASNHVHEEYKGMPQTSNAPLRGGKANIFEGGVRVPLLVSWPGEIEPGTVNSKHIVSSVDIYPTLLDMCGIGPTEGQPFDGESILATMKGGIFTRDEFFCHFPHYTPATGNIPASSVRKGDWKLIRFWHDNYDQSHRYELYNLQWDIGETTNLASLHPGKVEELIVLLDNYLEETGTLVPIPNPEYLKFEP